VTAASEELEEPVTTVDEVHQMLLRLAGRLPDEMICRARTWLDEGETERLANEFIGEMLQTGVVLSDRDVDVLVALLAAHGADAEVLSGAQVHWAAQPVPYLFSPSGPGEPPGEESMKQFLVDAPDIGDDYAEVDDVRGMWRAWRSRPDLPDEPPVPVYVVEVDWGNPSAITEALQQILIEAGQVDPRVEVYQYDVEPPVYQQLARLHGALLWARSPEVELRTAQLFDHLDLEHGPTFAPDHPLMEDADEAELVLEYLDEATTLPVNTVEVDDVIDRQRNSVPTIIRTDGTWIWTDSTAYYLREYGLQPDPALLAHIRENGYELPEVDGVDVHRALAAAR
jgi:hypothetical protein